MVRQSHKSLVTHGKTICIEAAEMGHLVLDLQGPYSNSSEFLDDPNFTMGDSTNSEETVCDRCTLDILHLLSQVQYVVNKKMSLQVMTSELRYQHLRHLHQYLLHLKMNWNCQNVVGEEEHVESMPKDKAGVISVGGHGGGCGHEGGYGGKRSGHGGRCGGGRGSCGGGRGSHGGGHGRRGRGEPNNVNLHLQLELSVKKFFFTLNMLIMLH